MDRNVRMEMSYILALFSIILYIYTSTRCVILIDLGEGIFHMHILNTVHILITGTNVHKIISLT